ncbi:MAG TPA: hypothetical protein VFG49_10825 [Dyella sp.]|uniref:hypothetical protein n=1 Tax=Dyella sp. TaxID=1869338 RepID=UPI002D791F76|nr:hypothetical protein [Dyella sp.]HET6554018.1 hypothetical protein [Dyella sp.]
MKKTLAALLLAGAVAPLAAQASQSNDISYTYVQLDYANMSQSGHGFVADGGSLSGSYGFADHFQVFGSYSNLRGDKESMQVLGYTFTEQTKNHPWSLGVGYFTAIGNRADWVTQLSYTRDRFTHRFCMASYGCDGFSNRFDVGAIQTGIMGHITDRLIGNAYLGYGNGGHGVTGKVYGDFGLMYAVNHTWGVRAGVMVNNDSTETFTLGVRASF